MRFILTILLSFAIALSGVPLQAAPACPMAAQMKEMDHSTQAHKDCEGCDKTGKQAQNNCCNDKACAAKCSTTGTVGNAVFAVASALEFHSVAVKFLITDSTLSSHFLQTQERPPRHFA